MKKQYSHSHFDSGETIFFQEQLQTILTGVYDIKYPLLKARTLFPVSMSAGQGAQTIAYNQYDMVGMGKIIANYADDAPRADVKGKQFFAQIQSLGSSYGYSLQEVRAAKMAGEPLVQSKANAAKRAIMQKENAIAFVGDTNYNLPGFLTNSNIPVVALANGAVGASTRWATKSPAEILADMNAVANNPMNVSNGIEMADTMLLPLAQYNQINSQVYSVAGYGTDTILSFFLKTNEFIKEVTWVNELKGAGPGGSDVMAVYRRDSDVLELHIPQDFEQLPPQERNYESVINCHERIAGVIVYYPLACAFGYGI